MRNSGEATLSNVQPVRMNEMMDFINLVEKEFPVSDWKIDHVRIWPLVRWNLGWSFSSKLSGQIIEQYSFRYSFYLAILLTPDILRP